MFSAFCRGRRSQLQLVMNISDTYHTTILEKVPDTDILQLLTTRLSTQSTNIQIATQYDNNQITDEVQKSITSSSRCNPRSVRHYWDKWFRATRDVILMSHKNNSDDMCSVPLAAPSFHSKSLFAPVNRQRRHNLELKIKNYKYTMAWSCP
jgi:hypothetical protein